MTSGRAKIVSLTIVVLCKSEILHQLFNSGQFLKLLLNMTKNPGDNGQGFDFHFKTAFSPIFTLLVKRVSHFLKPWGFFGHVKLKCY